MREPDHGAGAAGPRIVWRHLGAVLNKAAASVRELANGALAPLGLEIRQFIVLTFLRQFGPVSQQSLGEYVRIDRTTMVSLVDDLERKGFVERRRNPEDRRAYAIHITSSGREVQQRAEEVLERADDEFMAPLSRDEREQLRELLVRLVEPT